MPEILLIDDDDALRNVLAKALAHVGHHVVQAADGREGLELYHARKFDLVITDLIMPVQEGVETILRLKKEGATTPVIAISGSATNSKLYLEIAAKIGARRVLQKPFSPQELLAVINEVLPESPPP